MLQKNLPVVCTSSFSLPVSAADSSCSHPQGFCRWLMHSRSIWKDSDEADCGKRVALVNDSENAIFKFYFLLWTPHQALDPSHHSGIFIWGSHIHWRYLGLSEDTTAPNTLWLTPFVVPGDPWTCNTESSSFLLPCSTSSVLFQFLGLQLDSSTQSRWLGEWR